MSPASIIRRHSRRAAGWRCWIASAILAFGFPALLFVVSNLLASSFPRMAHGTAHQRFVIRVAGGIVVEWAAALALWFLLRRTGQSFRDLGLRWSATWYAWLIALAFAALSIGSNLTFLSRMHIPLSYAFVPPVGIHLYAALILGVTAGFCEEVLFRGFLMNEFATAGYGKIVQVVVPGLAFGLAHLAYGQTQGLLSTIGIMAPTALLGMVWGIAYLMGRRALMPCIVAHYLNDSTALPWIVYFMFTGRAL